ncbi:MAG: HAMP domain-containing histidine kinase, partial [Butyrivibrio sp.]|nr:HAMP domain-containing histidine kinase [Butyrivibrio sp.]
AGKPDIFGMHGMREQDAKSMVYTKIITDADGNEYVLFANSLITPVDATVHTLRVQFVYISVIFAIITLAVALVISRYISKPIANVNESAKKLAEGNFDVSFEGGGYREVCELSETLNYAARELGRTGRLQRDLIANVSHDLRTPLTMITAYSEVMRDLPGENTPENAQVIIDESRRLTTLVNDMLDLSKLQAGVTELKAEKFDFTASILAVMKRFSKLTEQSGYTINFEYEDDVKVCADEFKIHQVIYNLINNAINYAGEDKTVIVRQKVFGMIVRLEVEDHGIGIADDELANIWDRYYKVDKNHRRAIQGSGIGLSIVQNILKLHNARYGVDSTEGKGCVFWFELQTAADEE